MFQQIAPRIKVCPFSITWFLQEETPQAKSHSFDEAEFLIGAQLKKRAYIGQPFLDGIVTAGTAVRVWSQGPEAIAVYVPVAIFSGEKSPLYDSDMTDEQFHQFLNELASDVGYDLNQSRVEVRCNGEAWALQDSRRDNKAA